MTLCEIGVYFAEAAGEGRGVVAGLEMGYVSYAQCAEDCFSFFALFGDKLGY